MYVVEGSMNVKALQTKVICHFSRTLVESRGFSSNQPAPAVSTTERTRVLKTREDSQRSNFRVVSRNAQSKKQPVAFSTQKELTRGVSTQPQGFFVPSGNTRL